MTAAGPTKGSASRRTPVTLVTGFLGSGKTTLINRALKAPGMERTVVVINEFGEVQLDHQLVAASDDAVVVLENGCLCCTVRSDLVGTLNALWHDREAGRIPRFDRVVIETSGLAEPGPVLQAFLSEPTLDGLYRVAATIALVDAVNWDNTVGEHDEAVRQVTLADLVLITKLDLADRPAEREAELRRAIARLNPAAEVIAFDPLTGDPAAIFARAGADAASPEGDAARWLRLEAYAREADDHHDHDHHDHHDHDGDDHHHDHHFAARGVESFVLIREAPLSRDELRLLLDGIAQNLGPGLLRVKGLVNIKEEPGRPAVIQGAQQLLHTMTWLQRWPDADERSRLVFITQGIARSELRDVIELMSRVSERTAAARERAAARKKPVD
jgi:G3E family GTPase